MRRNRSLYEVQLIGLKKRIFEAGAKLGVDLEDPKIKQTLIAIDAASDDSWDTVQEDAESIFRARYLALSVVCSEIDIVKKTDEEIIEALCLGNWLVGFLDGAPKYLTSPRECPTCVIKKHSSVNGEKGAAMRHAPMRELRQWAKLQYKPAEWSSANEAAHAMKEKIIAYGRTINAELQAPNAQRTIAEWFRKSV